MNHFDELELKLVRAEYCEIFNELYRLNGFIDLKSLNTLDRIKYLVKYYETMQATISAAVKARDTLDKLKF